MRVYKKKPQKVKSVNKDKYMEKQKLLYIAIGNTKWSSHCAICLVVNQR